MPSNNDLTSNITVSLDTQLVPPAIVNCDIDTKNFARITNVQLINNCIFVKGILKKIILYKTFDVHSKLTENTLFNECEFNTTFELSESLLNDISFIPIDAISVSTTPIDTYLSGLGEYHRCHSLVAFSLTEDVYVTLTLNPELFLEATPSDFLLIDDFYPQLSSFINRNVTIPLRGQLSNCGLSNLNIKRFFVVNATQSFSEGILCDCCILYSFLNTQNELICSEQVKFNYIINNNLINSLDDYQVVGSDILDVLNSSISNNTLTETLSLKFITQRLD